MNKPITLCTAQWTDLSFEEILGKAKSLGYDGVELACWGDHFEVMLADDDYCHSKRKLLNDHGLACFSISNHLVGQAVCDRIDERHKNILPAHIWEDGEPEGVRQRAAQEMVLTGQAAARFGVSVVNGFTGSPIWHLAYGFPPALPGQIDAGFQEFAERWTPILNEFEKVGVRFALEVHPTEIAFDIASARRALAALNHHPAFGFNYDPSHLAYQGVDYIKFLYEFHDRIFHVHMKDVTWSKYPTEAGLFGGHTNFHDPHRYWDFRSLGRGNIDFEKIIRALNHIGYTGPLSVEWEDGGMDREFSAAESLSFIKRLDFPSSSMIFDASFETKKAQS